MRAPNPVIPFLKKFFCCLLVLSCSREDKKTGPYAEARFLPAPGAQIHASPSDPSPVVLNAGDEKLAREITHHLLIAKTLILLNHSPLSPGEIKKQLSCEVEEGILCLRFYNGDENFSTRFLQVLMETFEKEKNTAAQRESGKKLRLLEKDMKEKNAELKILEDSLVKIKDQYHLLISQDEIVAALQNGNLVLIDSTGLIRFNQVRSLLEQKVQEYTRQMRQKDELATQHDHNRFSLYRIEQAHYVRPKK